MKNNVRRRCAIGVIFALVVALSGGFIVLNSGHTAYAESLIDKPATFEEFDAELSGLRERLAEYEAALETARAIDGYDKYQDLWQALDDYVATEQVHWKQIAGIYPWCENWGIESLTYDDAAWATLLDRLKKYDTNFAEHYTKVSDLENDMLDSSVLEIRSAGYWTLQVGHLRAILASAHEYYDSWGGGSWGTSSCADGDFMRDYYNVIDENVANLHTLSVSYIAELHNRVAERDVFSDTQDLATKWWGDRNTDEDYIKLRNALSILKHAEQLVTWRYYPVMVDGVLPWDPQMSFGEKIADVARLGESYTLEQLIAALSSYTGDMGSLDKDKVIATMRRILESETQNLKDALRKIEPTLTDLETKTVDELIALGEGIDRDTTVVANYIDEKYSKDVQELAREMVSLEVLLVDGMMDEYPADKYFPDAQGTAMMNLGNNWATHISANDVIERIDSEVTWDYYGRMGNAALQIDRTVTDGLYPHPDWVMPTEPEDPTNPGDTLVEPSGEQDKDNQGGEGRDDLTPNTGVFGFGKSSVGAAVATGIGMVAGVGIVIAASLRFFHKRRS